jgi:hypothetical protein
MDFYGGFYGFSLNLATTLIVSWFEDPPPDQNLDGLVYWYTSHPARKAQPFYQTPAALAIAALLLAIALDIIFW